MALWVTDLIFLQNELGKFECQGSVSIWIKFSFYYLEKVTVCFGFSSGRSNSCVKYMIWLVEVLLSVLWLSGRCCCFWKSALYQVRHTHIKILCSADFGRYLLQIYRCISHFYDCQSYFDSLSSHYIVYQSLSMFCILHFDICKLQFFTYSKHFHGYIKQTVYHHLLLYVYQVNLDAHSVKLDMRLLQSNN